MVTDGVLDALPAKEQEEQMIDIIQNTNIVNPTEFARSIPGQYDGGRNVRRTVRGRIPGRDGGADDEYGAGDRKGRSEILHTGCMSV